MKAFGEIHLDGRKALRTAAAAGLAVLGVALLPGLMRAPEPEPLPPDVGFRPAENLSTPAPPDPGQLETATVKRNDRDRGARDGKSRDGEREIPNRSRNRRQAGNRATDRSRDPDRRSDSPAPASIPDEPEPATNTAAAPVVPWTPPPAPTPAPATGDGSIEFAPR